MTLHPMERWNLGLSAGAVAASFALASPRFACSVAAGAALEALNFRGLHRASELFFEGALPGSWQAGFALRFGLLAAGIVAAVLLGAHPIGLLAGLSIMVPAAVIGAWRSRPPIQPDAPALDPDDPEWERWDPWLAREREDDKDDA
jgi:hypothetical protein